MNSHEAGATQRGDAETQASAEADGLEDHRLRSLVRPADWPAPPVREGRYDLIVIGGGTGGLVSASIAASLGARVALIERALLGGDCLNTGCVPSKALLAAARGWTAAREVRERFGGPACDGDGDFPAVMARMRRIRADIAPADSAARFRDLGVDVFLDEATFVTGDAVEVGGRRLAFRRAIIATGARPTIPPIPGLAESGCETSETIFSLTTLPRRLVVIGAGPIGCELAQAFAAFGSQVTLLEEDARILPREEADAAAVVQSALDAGGVTFIGGARVVRVTQGADAHGVLYEGDGDRAAVDADRVLVAVGRAPSLDALGLDAAGIDAADGRVAVDDRLRTTNRRVYAVGDAASPLQFTHAADAQARLAVRNALFGGRAKASALIIPWCTYTFPELARVGLSAGEAAERGVDIESVTVPFADVDRARLDGETDGFARVHVEAGGDGIVGATIVGAHAGELIAQLAQTMKAGAGLESLGDVVFPYPTRAEILRKLGDLRRRRKLTPTARKAFELFFRLTGRRL